MAIYFRDHFGMTRGVSPDFMEQEGAHRAWGNIEPRTDEGIEIPEGYQVLGQSERYLGLCLERVARIALGVLCTIASFGFGLYFSESIRRCFTGRQVIVLLNPPIEEEAHLPALGLIQGTKQAIEQLNDQAREQPGEGGFSIVGGNGPAQQQNLMVEELIQNLGGLAEDPIVMARVCAEFGADALRSAPPAIQDNFTVVLSAVIKDGMALSAASERLCNHRGIVTAACTAPGGHSIYYANNVLYYASDALKADEEFVLGLVKRNGLLLEHIDADFRVQERFVRAAVRNNGLALRFAADHFKENEAIVRLALRQNGLAYRFIGPGLLDNRQLALIAVKQCGYALSCLPLQWKMDRQIVMAAIEQISTLKWEEKQSGPAILRWVGQTFAGQALLQDRELILAAVRGCGRNLEILKDCNSPFVNDREIVEAAMDEWPWALAFASEELQNDPELQAKRDRIIVEKLAVIEAIGGQAELRRIAEATNALLIW